MKKISLFLALFISAIVFTGCFEVIEEVNYKKDGSGTYTFAIDMSGMRDMLEMAMAFDTTGQFNIDTLGAISGQLKDKVAGLDGISNIKEIRDLHSLTFGVSFDFKDIKALNLAANELQEDENLTSSAQKKPVFITSRRSFERVDTKGLGGMVDQLMGTSGDESEAEMAMMFLKDVTYTMVYRFDRSVRRVSNKDATVSGDKKSVTLKFFPFDEERGGKNTSIGNLIRLR